MSVCLLNFKPDFPPTAFHLIGMLSDVIVQCLAGSLGVLFIAIYCFVYYSDRCLPLHEKIFIFGKQSQINLQSYLTKQTAFMPSLWESSVFFAKERNELV